MVLVPWPPFTDPAYYSMIAQRLAEGHGFTTPVMWSFIEVGSVIPDPAVLPIPSNAHWMPLTSIVAAASMARLRADLRRRHGAARHPLRAARPAHVPRHDRDLGVARHRAAGGGPGDLRRTAVHHVSDHRQLRRVRRDRRRLAVLLDARGPGGPARAVARRRRRVRRARDAVADRWRLPRRRRRRRLARPARLDAMAAARSSVGQPSAGASPRRSRSSPCWRRGSRATWRSSARSSHRPAGTRCGSPSTTSSSRSATRSACPRTSTGAG